MARTRCNTRVRTRAARGSPSRLRCVAPVSCTGHVTRLSRSLHSTTRVLMASYDYCAPFETFLVSIIRSSFTFVPGGLSLVESVTLKASGTREGTCSGGGCNLIRCSVEDKCIGVDCGGEGNIQGRNTPS